MNPNDDDVWMMVTRCDRGWRWTVYRGNVSQRSRVHQLEAVAYLVGWYVTARVRAIVFREVCEYDRVSSR